MGKISASMMCASYLRLEEDIRQLELAGADFLHFDIMDGHFVPNITLGTDYLRAVRSATKIPFDIHLMVCEPMLLLEWICPGPGDMVTVHQEGNIRLQRVLQAVRGFGAAPAVALNPATPAESICEVLPDIETVLLMTVNPGFSGQHLIPHMIDKILRTRLYLDACGYPNISIQVDGNVSFENAPRMRKAGADIFVAGSSSVFGADGILEGMRRLREAVY